MVLFDVLPRFAVECDKVVDLVNYDHIGIRVEVIVGLKPIGVKSRPFTRYRVGRNDKIFHSCHIRLVCICIAIA